MKKIAYIILTILFNSCTNNVEVEPLRYSENNLVPLSDSTKNIYYRNAAYIEYGEILKDSIKKYTQVELNKNNIQTYYDDLIFIYNNSYKVSNSFFEYANLLHSHFGKILYKVSVSIDTTRSWFNNWDNGNKYTGIAEIDSILNKYNLDVEILFNSDSRYWFTIKSKEPINVLSLMTKLKKTNEFLSIEPTVLVGGGSNILMKNENNTRIYTYYYGWGDCPSGCINYHYWILKLINDRIELYEEGGDPLE